MLEWLRHIAGLTTYRKMSYSKRCLGGNGFDKAESLALATSRARCQPSSFSLLLFNEKAALRVTLLHRATLPNQKSRYFALMV